MSSLVEMFYDQFCCPASSWEDNGKSHVVRQELCTDDHRSESDHLRLAEALVFSNGFSLKSTCALGGHDTPP